MICLICRQSDLVDDLTSIPFGRSEFRLLIRDVPAWVCPNCGEAVVDEGVAVQLICLAEDLFDEGIREDVCEYRHFAKVTRSRTTHLPCGCHPNTRKQVS